MSQELHGAVGLSMTRLVLASLVSFALAGCGKEPIEEAGGDAPTAPVVTTPVTPPPATYQVASSEALAAAKQYLESLDQAMASSAVELQSHDLERLGNQSRYFKAQVESGRVMFGETVFDPLGRCFAAGNAARTWWHAQLDASRKDGVESVPGSIKDALAEYQTNRTECLEDADPTAPATAARDAELKEKFGGRECLTSFHVDPETKEVVAKPKPAHCHEQKKIDG